MAAEGVRFDVATASCQDACEEEHTLTHLDIDPELLARAHAVGGEKTKKATVTRALEAFVARHEQRRILESFGTLDWDPTYDYKASRTRGIKVVDPGT